MLPCTGVIEAQGTHIPHDMTCTSSPFCLYYQKTGRIVFCSSKRSCIMRYLFLLLCCLVTLPATAQEFRVRGSTPAHGDSSVVLETTVSFTFSAPLDTTVNFSADGGPLEFFAISPPDSIHIDSTYYSDDLTQAFFDVSHTQNTDFVWVLTGAMDEQGAILCEPYVLQYTTASRTGPFSVSGGVNVAYPVKRAGQDCRFHDVVVLLYNQLPEIGGQVKAAAAAELDFTTYAYNYTVGDVREGTYYVAAPLVIDGLVYPFIRFYDSEFSNQPEAILVADSSRTGIDFLIAGPGAVQHPAEIPGIAALLPNYPNPLNPQTTLRYRLDRPARIELSIYDILGRRVALLAEGWQPAGPREVVWRPGALPSGVYLLRLQVGTTTLSRTLLLAK